MSQKQLLEPTQTGAAAKPLGKGGITFHLLIKRKDGEEVKEVTEEDLEKYIHESTEIFNDAKSANERCDAIARERVTTKHRKLKIKAKIEQQRREWRAAHPEAAKHFARLESQARDAELEHLATVDERRAKAGKPTTKE